MENLEDFIKEYREKVQRSGGVERRDYADGGISFYGPTSGLNPPTRITCPAGGWTIDQQTPLYTYTCKFDATAHHHKFLTYIPDSTSRTQKGEITLSDAAKTFLNNSSTMITATTAYRSEEEVAGGNYTSYKWNIVDIAYSGGTSGYMSGMVWIYPISQSARGKYSIPLKLD